MVYRKRYKKSNWYKKNNYSSRSNAKKEADAIVGGIAWICLLWYIVYIQFLEPNLEVFNFYAKIWFVIILCLFFLYIWFQIRKYLKNKKLKEEKIENMPIFIRELENKIREFKPSQHYKEEKYYQVELIGFLKNNYPNCKIEEYRDFKRPDIVIDNIAIEIKWPTHMSWLKTLPDKINSYIPTWDYLFIVLFNIEVHPDKEQNMKIYLEKKNQIIENTIEAKKEKVIFIEI